MIFGDDRLDLAFSAQRKAVRQVFLDRHKPPFGVSRQIDDRKPAQRELVLYAVFVELVSGRKGVVCLLRHRYRSYHVGFQPFSGFDGGL